MNSVDKQYQDLLKNILENGNVKKTVQEQELNQFLERI